MAIKEMDFSLRVAIFAVAHVVVYAWARYIVAPGRPGRDRVLRALPLVPALLFTGSLFRGDDPDEALLAFVSASNFLWMTPSKIWSLAMNRGQLVKSYDSGRNGAFALGLLTLVTIEFETKPAEENADQAERKHAYKDVRFEVVQFKGTAFFAEAAGIVGRIVAKVALMFVMRKGYYYFRESQNLFWADVCLGWSLYGMTAYVQDISGLVVLLTLNLKLATNFDKPFLAQSMQELWSRRYNLVTGEALRDMIYDPICEKKLVKGSIFHATKTRSPARRAIAVLLTFGFSGFMHAFIFWFSLRGDFPLLYGAFFVACGLVVIAENVVKAALKMSGYSKIVERLVPGWICVLYTLGTMFVLGHSLFLPDMHAAGLGPIAADLALRNLRLV